MVGVNLDLFYESNGTEIMCLFIIRVTITYISALFNLFTLDSYIFPELLYMDER